VIGQHAFAVIVRRWLCELARTRDVTASHVEPIPFHPPLRNLRHDWPPFWQKNLSALCCLCPTELQESEPRQYGTCLGHRIVSSI
jgi:hypothetical protein